MSRLGGERVQDLLGRYVRAPAGLPVKLRRRLDRSRRHECGDGVVSDSAAPDSAAPDGAAPDSAAPDRGVDLPEDLREARTTDGVFAERTVVYSASHLHGDFRFSDALCGDTRAFGLLTGDAALVELDLRRAVFLDTETTGLGGGAGVHVFMVGLARFIEDGNAVEVWQGFLRSPDDEFAMLSEVTRRVAEAQAIVSFFGKSFDRHRLEDKMRSAGVAAPFADRPHLDLYHPLQRLTRGTFPDGRLATLEAELCGFRRPDDLPGAFAPEAWFDFLAERPHRLRGVFQHNEDDVLSLIALTGYLSHVLEERHDGTALAGCALTRARALARAYCDAGKLPQALAWNDRAFTRAGPHDQRMLRMQRAELLRKHGDPAAAHEIYLELAAQPEDPLTAAALIELAKLEEHHLRDPAAALSTCERAIRLTARWHTGTARTRLESELPHRAQRLRRKLARSGKVVPSGKTVP